MFCFLFLFNLGISSFFLASFCYGLKIDLLKLPRKESFGVMSINSVNVGMTKSVRNDLYPHFTIFRYTNLKSKNINDIPFRTDIPNFSFQNPIVKTAKSNSYLNVSNVQRLFWLPCNSSFASNNFAIGGCQLVQDFFRNVASHVEMRVKSMIKRTFGSSVISSFQKPE